MREQSLFIHHVAVVEHILGPGRRLVVWTTGCPYQCDGCIEKKLRQLDFGDPYRVNAFYRQLEPLLNTLQAVTFSGGEPLFQKYAMLSLLQIIKQRQEIETMLYTGMDTTRFLNKYKDFHPFIDICITEPFLQQQHGNHLWRGSANQQILSPSGKYGKDMLEEWGERPSAGVDIHFEADQCFTYGIPTPGCLNYLDGLLLKEGILVKQNT